MNPFSESSVSSIGKWIEDVKKHAAADVLTSIVIVLPKNEVSCPPAMLERIQAVAAENNLLCFEVSLNPQSRSVDVPFNNIIKQLELQRRPIVVVVPQPLEEKRRSCMVM